MSDDRQARIEKRAREVWQREGCPEGRAEEHWRIAESEVDAESAAAKKSARSAAVRPGKDPAKPKPAAKSAAKSKTAEPKADKVKVEAAKADEAKKAVKKKK